ncbi:unnamed protein product [Adineta steineri]|uniref:G-protein coupled receptors family 1 profile domain-containing protein n=1 Tax=Adineta steineri TaxID=433720 RepID=A0A815PF61_9BILA|nr:unnamed protein product [Adineta steineri]CAF1448565.1 unnamed protein product [Adineta steineri]
MLKIWFYILIILHEITNAAEISYNQPKLPSCPQWDPYGITFANETTVGSGPLDIFIDRNNTIYVTDEYNGEIEIWNVEDLVPKTIKLDDSFEPWGLFVTIDENIYVGSEPNKNVEKWTLNETRGTIAMNTFDSCPGMFVDIKNNIYCSLGESHKVIKQSLDNDSNIILVVAGNGSQGSANNMLNRPRGIFVTISFDLYVADCFNDRIQLFKSGQLNGITITESISTSSFNLLRPTGVFLDSDNYIYIVDNANHRIIGSRSTGFYCIAGCTSKPGSTSTHLDYPYAAVFDKFGNIFVTDQDNNRIQKFLLITNNSNSSPSIQSTYSSTLTENSQIFAPTDCGKLNYYYETIQVEVNESGCYNLVSKSGIDIYGYISEDYFKPIIPTENSFSHIGPFYANNQFKLETSLLINTKYILVVTTLNPNITGNFSVIATGPNHVIFNRINVSWSIQKIYSSQLPMNDQVFTRSGCQMFNYYYEAVKINVIESGYYIFTSNSTMNTYGFMYENDFNVFRHRKNLLLEDNTNGCNGQFKISIQLHTNTTYVFLVTTYHPNVTGNYSLLVFGPNNITLNPINNLPQVFQNEYSSALITTSREYGREKCQLANYYYEDIEMNVMISGSYTITSHSNINTFGYLYKDRFNPLKPLENSITRNDENCDNSQFQIVFDLYANSTYVLVVTTYFPNITGEFLISASGPKKINFNPIDIQTIYTSILTKDTQTYSRVCGRTQYYYETIEINVENSSIYRFDSNSSIIIYGYIYENNFNPFNPTDNLVTRSNYSCGGYEFQFTAYLHSNITYILVITTFHSNVQGPFSLIIYGSNNITLNRTINNRDECIVGDRCNSYTKGIGLTLDDILRNEIRRNTTINNQSFLIKISIALTIIIFVGGLINSILSLITFQNLELRKVGCGIYLLSSSITSLLTISMLTIKFWFVILTQINLSVNKSILQIGCISIESLLKVFVYADTWLNACVAVERAVNVSQGVRFNKNKSKRIARRISIILPLFVMITLIHEPIHRHLLEYTTEKYTSQQYDYSTNETNQDEINNNINDTDKYEMEYHILCVINYSRSVQDYNTAILFFHLVTPFIANLISAFYIVFGTARQRSITRTKQTYIRHILEQIIEHKQLIISPLILLILSMPRLIISLISGCVDVSNNPWLYLSGYFISFTPSMLIFVVFVFPSKLYMKTFKDSLQKWKRSIYS